MIKKTNLVFSFFFLRGWARDDCPKKNQTRGEREKNQTGRESIEKDEGRIFYFIYLFMLLVGLHTRWWCVQRVQFRHPLRDHPFRRRDKRWVECDKVRHAMLATGAREVYSFVLTGTG